MFNTEQYLHYLMFTKIQVDVCNIVYGTKVGLYMSEEVKDVVLSSKAPTSTMCRMQNATQPLSGIT